MSKWILFFLFWGSVGLEALVKDLEKYPPDIRKILERGELIVAIVDQERPPFFMKEKNDQFFGADRDMAQAIADELGVSLSFKKASSYEEVVQTVFQREADLAVSDISKVLSREEKVLFSDPYLDLHMALMVSRFQKEEQQEVRYLIRNFNREGSKIGVLQSTSLGQYGEQIFPKASQVKYPSWKALISGVETGEVDVGLVNEIVARVFFHLNPQFSLKVKAILIEDVRDRICFITPWDSFHFIFWLNNFLKMSGKKRTLEQILQTYSEFLKPQEVP